MKILIVKLSSLGDVVHAMPAAQDLRQVFVQAHVEMKDEEAVGAQMLVPEKDFDEIHEAIEKVQNLIKD